MKKLLFILFTTISTFIFFSSTVKAEKGICIIQQLTNTYEVETPFFWYRITENSTLNTSMQQLPTYTSSTVYVDTELKCNQINNSTPSYQKNSNTFLDYTITNFYFSKEGLSSNAEIFEKSQSVFKYAPSSLDLKIKATFISLDNLPPVISTNNLNPIIITTPELPISVAYLKSKLTAYDEVDGVTEIKIHEDNYTKNSNNIGEYTVTYSATDESNNTAYITITIKIEDKTKPTIIGNTSIKSNMSNPLTIKQIKDTLSVKDNYYQISNSSINLFKDTYTGNEQIEGTFTVSFKVSDPSNNTSDEFIINIRTYDDIAPTIKGDTSYEISNKKLLDLTQISNKLIANDNIDNSPTIELIDDTYSSNYHIIGLYQITYIAKDKNNNTSLPYTININVKDTTKPTIYISKKFIGVDGSANINIEDIIEIIEQSNNINSNQLLNKTIIKDEYTNNKNTPGEYIVKLNYEYEDGEIIDIETYIIVDNYSKTPKKEIKSTPSNKSFWSAIKDFFLKLWNFIKYIFSFIWLKELI